jgi:hypothetical protein
MEKSGRKQPVSSWTLCERSWRTTLLLTANACMRPAQPGLVMCPELHDRASGTAMQQQVAGVA